MLRTRNAGRLPVLTQFRICPPCTRESGIGSVASQQRFAVPSYYRFRRRQVNRSIKTDSPSSAFWTQRQERARGAAPASSCPLLSLEEWKTFSRKLDVNFEVLEWRVGRMALDAEK